MGCGGLARGDQWQWKGGFAHGLKGVTIFEATRVELRLDSIYSCGSLPTREE